MRGGSHDNDVCPLREKQKTREIGPEGGDDLHILWRKKQKFPMSKQARAGTKRRPIWLKREWLKKGERLRECKKVQPFQAVHEPISLA